MLISSKRYPEEFKIEAVKQVTEKGHSVAEVAARLGTTTHSLYVWIKRYDPQQPKIIESGDPLAELAKLKMCESKKLSYWFTLNPLILRSKT
ncbi:transposase [Acinetobacter bohemicus]|uniref:Transposase n=2 Tax=Acinetobacter TaxID=469 RepID=A0A7S9DPB0_ACIJO|nr:hypothetical protein E10B_00079 [Acinetobacter johnsonii]SFT25312.1 transposase [Acinetobacter bohemicus]